MGWADSDKQTSNYDKTYPFYRIKNIIESRSYEQIMNGPHVVEMTTTRARATHVRIAMRALTSISLL